MRLFLKVQYLARTLQNVAPAFLLVLCRLIVRKKHSAPLKAPLEIVEANTEEGFRLTSIMGDV